MAVDDDRTDENINDCWENFLRSYRQDESFVYMDYLQRMPARNKKTFYLDYNHLANSNFLEEKRQNQVIFLQKYVLKNTEVARASLKRVVFNMLKEFNSDFAEDCEKVFRAEFMNSPVVKNMPDITVEDAGTFVRTAGIVQEYDGMASTAVHQVSWVCEDGHETITKTEEEPKKCVYRTPDGITCLSKDFRKDERATKTEDFIRFNLQQRSDHTQEGKDPVELEYETYGPDNVQRVTTRVKFGDYIAVDGIIKTKLTRRKTGRGSVVGDKYIEACYFEPQSESRLALQDPGVVERMRNIIDTMPEDELVDKMVNSVCPSLLISPLLRKILLLFLVGSDYKELIDNKRIRGEIQLLILGDPGTGKSDITQFVKGSRDRALYNSAGKSTSVGLVGGYERGKDGVGRIKAGVFGLARNGVVILDEFAGRTKEDYANLLEPMSDMQSVSIAKGMKYHNEVVNTSVLAIANPSTYSRYYDPDKNIVENTDIPYTILQRFDAIIIMRDIANAEEDKKKARHFFSSQLNTVSKDNSEIFSIVEMKALIQILRERYHSTVSESPEAVREIESWYDLRRKFKITINKEKGVRRVDDPDNRMDIPSADMRRLGAVMRFAQAEARLRRSDVVTAAHVKTAMEIVDLTLAEAGHHRTLGDGTKEYMKDELQRQNEMYRDRLVQQQRDIFENAVDALTWLKCPTFKLGGCGGSGMIHEAGAPDDDAGYPCEKCKGVGWINQEFYKDQLLENLGLTKSSTVKPPIPGRVFDHFWDKYRQDGAIVPFSANAWENTTPRLKREKRAYKLSAPMSDREKLRQKIEHDHVKRFGDLEKLR